MPLLNLSLLCSRFLTLLISAALVVGCAKVTPGGKIAPLKAKGITVQVDEDTRKDISLAVETPNARMRFSISGSPEFGSIEKIDEQTGVVNYRPQPNFSGVDHFKYEVEDLLTKSSEEVTVVVLPVNDAPVAEEKTFSTMEDTSLMGTVSGKDLDSNRLTYAVSTPPTKGTVTLDSNLGSFVYVPNADQNGDDTFFYRANDGALFSEPAAVKITITPVKDAPSARPLTISGDEDTQIASTLVAIDPDSANLTYAMATAPTKGVVTITNTATGAFEYRPNLNQNGADTFTFTASDGELTSDPPGTVTININPVNDPPVLTPDTISVLPAVSNTFTVRALDPDGDALRFTVATEAKSGKVEVKDAAAGVFTYLPNQDDSGADSFTVMASDGSANSAAVEIKFRWLSTASVAGEKSAAAIDGSRLYTGMDSSSIEIYNASGARPALIGSFMTFGKPIHIEAFNRKLMVNTTGSKAGFYVYDTTDPASVQLLASIRGNFSSFKTVNNYAFLTGSALGSAVAVVNTDLRNTLVPLQSVSVVTSTANAIDIRENYAYVATNEGLRVIDISNPANLQLRGLIPTRNLSLGVSVKGNRAYVADGTAGVFLADISNPTDPREIARYTPQVSKVFSYVDVTDFYVLANGSILSPTTLLPVSAPQFTWKTLSSLPSASVRVSANNIDLFEAVSASAINRFPLTGSLDGVNAFTSSGNTAYAATRDRGLSIIDLTAGRTQPLSHRFEEEAQCGIAYGAPVVFLASCQNTIRVVNVSNPLIPSLVAATVSAASTRYRRLQYVSPYLYASTQTGIEIFEANTTSGTLNALGQFVLSPDVGAFSVLGDTLYVSSDSGVSVVDLKDRRTPRLAMRLNLPLTDTILASAPFLFVKASGDEDPSHTVFIYDITNPLSPALTSQYREPDSIGDFYRNGTNLFIAYARKLVRLDLRDPARPVKIELIPAPNARTNFTRLQLQLPKIIAVDLVYGRLSVFDNVPNLP